MQLAFDDRGLIPVVAQDAATGKLLMVAYANAEAVEKTRATGTAHFYSRSRKTLWKKGETSGNVMKVVEVRVDCDADCLLYLVDAVGPVCHTGSTSCFFRVLGDEERPDKGPPGNVLDRLARVIDDRLTATSGEKSYVRTIADAGWGKVLGKIGEEQGELAAELPRGDSEKVIHEAADLFFHVLVGLGKRGIDPGFVLNELERRFGTSGLDEKAARQA
jgi:phosphoribosyl-ATP pyrophosphohydrolase/phosphoribosyl-AMP cyclohydrolase